MVGRFRDVAAVVTVAAVLCVPSLFTRDPWNPDEPRYQEVAREMVSRGDYLVPHLNGEPYSDKPPVAFWLSAALWRLGLGLKSGRVVAFLATAGTLLVTYALGRRLYGWRVGLLATLITATCVLFAWISRLGVLDPPLTFLVVGAIACSLRAFEARPGRAGPWWLGFYALVALGILTKGPVALGLAGVVALSYGMARRKVVRGGGWWHLAGAALMLALVGAWVGPAAWRGGEAYANDLVVRQTLRRLAESDSHREPPHFYLKYAMACFFPWSLVLVLAFLAAVRDARRGEGGSWLPVLWLGVGFLFFTAFSSKRERYLLPLMPAAGLLCARYVWMAAREGPPWPRWHAGLWRATFVLLVAAAGGLGAAALMPGQVARKFAEDAPAAAEVREALGGAFSVPLLAAAVAMVAAGLYGLCSRRGGERRRVALAAGFMLVLSLVADLAVTPAVDRFKSGKDLVEESEPYLRDAQRLYLLGEDYSGVYNLYLRRDHIPVLADGKAAWKALATAQRVAVVGRKRHFGRTLHMRGARAVAAERVGHREMTVMANWKAEATSAP